MPPERLECIWGERERVNRTHQTLNPKHKQASTEAVHFGAAAAEAVDVHLINCRSKTLRPTTPVIEAAATAVAINKRSLEHWKRTKERKMDSRSFEQSECVCVCVFVLSNKVHTLALQKCERVR